MRHKSAPGRRMQRWLNQRREDAYYGLTPEMVRHRNNQIRKIRLSSELAANDHNVPLTGLPSMAQPFFPRQMSKE